MMSLLLPRLLGKSVDQAHDLVDRVGQVVEQVETVRDLDGVRSTQPGALGVASGPVTADHVRSAMLKQPVGEPRCPAVGQQVHGPAGVHVDNDGAVGIALAEREVVHADDRDRPRLRNRKRPDQP